MEEVSKKPAEISLRYWQVVDGGLMFVITAENSPADH